MAFTYGFYNSVDHDRLYNTEQFSFLFDGIINDGVFAKVGDRFLVSPATGMNVRVGSGRAWFNSTWNYNDSDYILEVPPSESVLNRIDAVVIEVNRNLDHRENAIKILIGQSASESPQKPELLRTEDLNQYPLAYIYVPKGSSEITSNNIEYVVGVTSECPFVTGPLTTVTMEEYLRQWSAEWELWKAGKNTDFDSWFSNIQGVLGDDVAGGLMAEIESVEQSLLANLEDHEETNITAHGVSRGRDVFAGGGNEVAIPHFLDVIPVAAYAFPLTDPQGYLGEVWIRMDAENIYVGNTGSYKGALAWTAIA